jgi:hypothetical protein
MINAGKDAGSHAAGDDIVTMNDGYDPDLRSNVSTSAIARRPPLYCSWVDPAGAGSPCFKKL